MTAPACGCGQPSPDAYLCTACTTALRADLTGLAAIAADLADAVARQLTLAETVRATGTPEPPLPYDPYAARVRGYLLGVLKMWSLHITHRKVSTVAGGAITLLAHLNDVRQHPDAWQASADIGYAYRAALKVIDRPPELRPAGECEACGAALRAELDADTARCRQCGKVNEGIAQRRMERAIAADLLGTATELSRQLAMLGTRVAAGTIRMWASRGRLSARPGPPEEPPWYAMSDVLVLVAERDARAAS